MAVTSGRARVAGREVEGAEGGGGGGSLFQCAPTKLPPFTQFGFTCLALPCLAFSSYEEEEKEEKEE